MVELFGKDVEEFGHRLGEVLAVLEVLNDSSLSNKDVPVVLHREA